jgi:hypothetical protein
MADEDDRPSSPSIPSWQRPNASDADATPNSLPQGTVATTQQDSNNDNTEETSQSNDGQDTKQQGQDEDPLAVARRFLEDENVKTQPREKKVSFLRAKGLSDGDIDTLLQDDIQTVEVNAPSSFYLLVRFFMLTTHIRKPHPPPPPPLLQAKHPHPQHTPTAPP